jgi:hypothetical protein
VDPPKGFSPPYESRRLGATGAALQLLDSSLA